MQIRQMTEADRPKVITLYRQVFSEAPWYEDWSTDAVAEQFSIAQLQWWVAAINEKIIGFCAGAVAFGQELERLFDLSIPSDTVSPMAYLAELGSSPHHRRQGIARALTQQFLWYAQTQKATAFCVRTRPGTGNNAWYERDPDLTSWHVFADGRILYGCKGIPHL